MVRISLVPALTPLYLYVSTFRSILIIIIIIMIIIIIIIIIINPVDTVATICVPTAGCQALTV
jgi:hypothetical protein